MKKRYLLLFVPLALLIWASCSKTTPADTSGATGNTGSTGSTGSTGTTGSMLPNLTPPTDTIPLANLGADFGVIGNEPVAGFTNGKSYGLEFFAQQRLNKGFYGIFALTLFKSEFEDKNGVYVQSSWNTRYILSMTGGKVFKKNWELGAKLRFTGGSPYTPYNIQTSSLKSNYYIYPQGIQDWSMLNADRLGSFYQLDARVDKKYPFRKFTLNLYFDFQNITNNQYQLQPYLVPDRDANGNLQDIPGDPTRFKTKFLSNKGGNVLPSLGLIVEL